MITSPLFTKAAQNFTLVFPLPIRTSSGFFVIGTFGNGFNQPFPQALRRRFRIRRMASSCLLLIFPASEEISPKSPRRK